MRLKLVLSYLIFLSSFCVQAQTVVCGDFSTALSVWGDSVEVNSASVYGGSGTNKVAEVDKRNNLEQTISGFLVGEQYVLTFQCSRRTSGTTPSSTDVNIRINNNSLNVYLVKVNSTFAFMTYSYTFTANASTLNLRISSGVLTGNATHGMIFDNIVITTILPLPIELTSFHVKQTKNNSALLEWETFTEVNNDYFTIEKSNDGEIWSEVVDINGAGHSYSIQNYSFIDDSPYLGTSYYRLKQTDFNVEFSYSDMVSFSNLMEDDILIYPNPSKDHVLNIRLKEASRQGISVYNFLNQLVFESEYLINDTLDLMHLSSGIYTVFIKSESGYVIERRISLL